MRWDFAGSSRVTALSIVFALAGCGGGSSSGSQPLPPPPSTAAAPAPVAATPPPDAPADWQPAEFKSGNARWKDTAVYLDGRPIAMLNFGELPITLQPYWYEERVSAPKKAGSKDPGYRIIKQRRYRFNDYLRALGVDPAKVREIHVVGPKLTETIIATGKDLISKDGKQFGFRFGGEVWGKALPVTPFEFGNGRSPDKIASVMIYIEKEPPRLVRNDGLYLGEEKITDVPYFGEPLRGGVRVYLDDRLESIIKRNLLEESAMGVKGDDGVTRWPLLAFLRAQGVDTSKMSEAWIISGEKRVERLSRAQLEKASFEASPQSKGEILIGDKKLPANAVAFHTKALRPEQLPVILPEEGEGAVEDPRAIEEL